MDWSLFLDIDGVLLPPGSHLSDSSLSDLLQEFVPQFQAIGVSVHLLTARPYALVEPLITTSEMCNMIAVTDAGGIEAFSSSNLTCHSVPKEILNRVLDQVNGFNTLKPTQLTSSRDLYVSKDLLPRIGKCTYSETIRPLSEAHYELDCQCIGIRQLSAIEAAELEREFNQYCYIERLLRPSGSFTIFIRSFAARKHLALMRLHESGTIHLAKTACVADEASDIPALQCAAFSACPGSADPEVTRIVTHASDKTGRDLLLEIKELFCTGPGVH